ncbi:hypothetical protein SAMN04489812_1987 [Microlunatus soli]|uniref:Zinc-binding dehydrogenase n=1 Tax=Microlunatus soli TaxID=630515 RepID=A0A1H1SEQ0_9ACTN|nr:hypothetical protein SAMN04489812_1987 [Microlunatus soli]
MPPSPAAPRHSTAHLLAPTRFKRHTLGRTRPDPAGRRHPGRHRSPTDGRADPGGHVGYVGVTHGVALDGTELFFSGVHLHGGPAPVRRFLPELIDLIMNGQIDAGAVFDLTLPLDRAADGYRAMDERRATKVLLTV